MKTSVATSISTIWLFFFLQGCTIYLFESIKPGQDSQDKMQCFSTETVGHIYIFPSSVHDSKMGKQGRPQMVRIFSAERVFDIHS